MGLGIGILGIGTILELRHWLGTDEEAMERQNRWVTGEEMKEAASLSNQDGKRSGPGAVEWRRSMQWNTVSSLGQEGEGVQDIFSKGGW